MKTPNLLSVLVLSLAAARTAHADAARDFATGSSVLIDVGTVVVGSPRTSTGDAPIAKEKGSLDFALRAEDLGIKLPATINFRGKDLGGGWVQYEIDDTYEKPIAVGGGHYLSRIEGHVFMRATSVRGEEKQTYGNTRLKLAGASYVVAHGDWGKYLVPISELALRGGIPQPSLSRFTLDGLVCSDKEKPTNHALAISLTGAAKGSGARVDLKAERGAGVHVPAGMWIQPGKQTAIVNAAIAPGFVGTTRVTASAGGVVQSLDVVVHPSGDCR